MRIGVIKSFWPKFNLTQVLNFRNNLLKSSSVHALSVNPSIRLQLHHLHLSHYQLRSISQTICTVNLHPLFSPISKASYTEVISTKFKSTFFFIHRLLPIVDFAQRHTAAPPSGLSSALNTTTVVPVHRHNHLKSVKNKHHRVKNCDLVVSACVLFDPPGYEV
ncbi:hypothetical protein QVD17_01584 [Tagetes erecta]|uniref:Uncharacterized protein n=1 Tax=Tagetes erecta TaxID=13708 RepID=A0AAD8L554_TARER|nr:hypothetical protein QVD17_01584 [Tagetes erecta]